MSENNTENKEKKREAYSLKSRKLRYGTYSTVTVIFVAAILIVLNLVLETVDLRVDLSADNLYTLSKDSHNALADLDTDVTLYTLFKTGEELFIYDELINDYKNVSSHITVENRDPYLYPQFVETYTEDGDTIPVNSVIVQGPQRYKVIKASELVTYGIDYNSYQTYVQSIDLEPLVTNAIRYVTAESTPVIYRVTGHNEFDLSPDFQQLITNANYEIRDLNLFEITEIPDDAAMLFVVTPERDWTLSESDMVIQWLEEGNNAIFLMDYTNGELANLKRVLHAYGVTFEQNLVLESDMSHLIAVDGGYVVPYFLIPDLVEHDITNSLIDKNYALLTPYVSPLQELDVRRKDIQIEPIVQSSPTSYLKTAESAMGTVNREEGDIDGPFDLVYAISENYYAPGAGGTSTTQIVLCGTSSILEDGYNNGSNATFLLNSLNWLADGGDSVFVRSKSITAQDIYFNSYDDISRIFIISFILIPGAILAVGIGVWLWRRNK